MILKIFTTLVLAFSSSKEKNKATTNWPSNLMKRTQGAHDNSLLILALNTTCHVLNLEKRDSLKNWAKGRLPRGLMARVDSQFLDPIEWLPLLPCLIRPLGRKWVPRATHGSLSSHAARLGSTLCQSEKLASRAASPFIRFCPPVMSSLGSLPMLERSSHRTVPAREAPCEWPI